VTVSAVQDAVNLEAFVAKGASADRIELLVRGAHCGACLARIEKAALAEPGVRSARFNLTTGKLAVTTVRGQADPGRLVKCISDLGFTAAPYDPSAALAEEDLAGRKLALALGVAGFGAGNVMMFTVPVWAGIFGQELTPATREVLLWLSAAVAAPCALFAGRPFFASAWRSLRKGQANMDLPISIGVLLTLGVSFSETIMGGAHAYFDAAIMLLFLLLIGRYLDHRLRQTARSAARDLLALQAPIAVRLLPGGGRTGVPVREVQPGDLLAVAPGQRVPVDGTVERGSSQVDNSLISGESLPVAAMPGARLYAGALNQLGELILRATAPSDESAIAEIARLMETGAQSRSRYVRLADKAAAIYVPVVHITALATFVGCWALGLGPREAILRAAAVLIVTCPCALGLAVPAVQVAASGRLFRKGVLVKSGAALERLAEINHVVFDKTGVLTFGQPTLLTRNHHLIAMAAPLARASRHPLAQALARAAGDGPVCEDAVETAGQGVEGYIDGCKARLGQAAFLGVADGGQDSELWFGFEGQTAFRFAFEDQIRPEAADVIKQLNRRGLTVEILSGDLPGAVERIARQAGVTQWSARTSPVAKAESVANTAATGRKTLMVGDGLNDAAALSKAHASMAPGGAVDASQNAADLVYSGGDLSAIPLAIDIARQARNRSRENMAFAALYNLVAAPAAILGLVNPFLAALAMSGSSLAVTLNALRVLWSKAKS
jgi:Cu2+-exporting ATPase